MHCTAQREPQELLGYWSTLVGLLCWSWEQGLWEKGQATSGYFLSFGIQSDCLFMEQRNSEASGTAQREKGMSVGVVCQHGMDPAASSCAPGRLSGWHKGWDVFLLFLLLPEIHITCKHMFFLPDSESFSLASSKPARYSSVPLSEGFVCSEWPTACFCGALQARGPRMYSHHCKPRTDLGDEWCSWVPAIRAHTSKLS